ncbi:uncharacterized protein [Spinacia oleracea]|uniref:Uncharacterized protein n=1 Tax=Spinacia oleracea TaxID=3562 RepID=A0ABM3R6C2_SPIOL|nr:uncharacterized protein LOC130466313 [Spinacia oleracea]
MDNNISAMNDLINSTDNQPEDCHTHDERTPRCVSTLDSHGSYTKKTENEHLNMKRNSEALQQPPDKHQPLNKQQVKKPRKLPKEKDFMDSMFISSPKITPRNAPSRHPRGGPTTTKKFVLQRRNTLCVSDPVTPATADLASTPVTPSTADLDEFFVSSDEEVGAIIAEHETEVQDKFAALGTSVTSTSPLPLDGGSESNLQLPHSATSDTSTSSLLLDGGSESNLQLPHSATSETSTSSLPLNGGSESNQPPDSAMTPFQRLLRLIHTVSDKTLESSMNDMYSAIQGMDKLAEFDSYDENKPS